ncbi:hypothetical protein SARC_06980 [Sphaeroforma arctica JP610]|uniref:Uncharacterized protein n=1 Tax=Sphaeroforma arctica JP610 TaxID=667725 RepID=A0A0L0FVU2_9EUKA|nr:hypothetical protein SARC_06980 [Sphaeroforma arctica JP610]KNC80666.1 hypothetical protein SARC_06980 [Sphaeroforma arctica JP610]|eukprot:XP_014154568.1 hypothetical protein SARC_06980 [Sphaeroforma arctica JP610]
MVRNYTHNTDTLVVAVLHKVLGCAEPNISSRQRPVEQDKGAVEAEETPRALQKVSNRWFIIENRREDKFAKDWLGPAEVLAHVALVMNFIIDEALNKGYRLHLKNTKACVPPFGRQDKRH